MPDILQKVQTVVLVMFENRSFDHMLGHLSYENINPQIDGLRQPLKQYENFYKGDSYTPYNIPGNTFLPFDLPHEYDDIATQLARSNVTKKYTMTGFVESYAKATSVNPNPQTEPMGYFTSAQVPITSFLARTFCTCDRWFSPLPSSTQPNKTMAFCGESAIFRTHAQLIPAANNIFDWLTGAGVRWRVYHDGLSFFVLYPRLWRYLLSANFRDYEYMYRDMQSEPADSAPQVIIVEPSYGDAPHIGPDHPNDNHAPLAIGWGEDFLRRTYEAVTANPARWGNTVMIAYYDEHGGFYDHVPPPPIGYKTTGQDVHQFDSLGPRIPGIIISPFVKRGSICHTVLDHTSVLQFLAEKFTPGRPYSPAVDVRKKQGIASISVALNNETPWTPPPAPSQPINVASALGENISTQPTSTMGQSFEVAAQELIAKEPGGVAVKYPELFQWRDAVAKARGR